MTRLKTVLCALLSALILSLIFQGSNTSMSVGVQAQELDGNSGELLDVVLLLDASGSMRLTDPKRLREQGAKLFLQFLKTGDRVGVIQFAKDVKIVRPLEEFTPYKMSEFERDIAQVGDGGTNTDILSAVTEAAKQLLETGRPNAKKLMVLLSDGKMDPDPSVETPGGATRRLLQDILPDLKVRGVTIHTLAFSEEADTDILSQIALGTDGINWFTSSVEQVHKSFADLFLVVKKPQVVPLTKKGFTIDEAVDEATYYVDVAGNDELVITSPLGKRFTEASENDGIKWFKGENFAVITIEQPDVGVWIVEGLSKRDGFATVLTSLKLLAEWPNVTRVAEKTLLRAQLYEGDRPIALPDMSGVVKYAYQITPTDKISAPVMTDFLHDDGKDGDSIANDGIFSAFIEMEDDGEYRLRVIARAPTFEREQNRPFRVRDPWIKLEVGETTEAISDVSQGGSHVTGEHGEEEADHGHGSGHATTQSLLGVESEEKEVFRITLSPDVSSFKDIEISLAALDDQSRRHILPVTKSRKEEYVYFTPTSYLIREGVYELRALVTLKPRTGVSQKELSKPLKFTNHAASHDSDSEIQEVVVQKKEDKTSIHKEDPFPIAALIIITIINCFLGAGVMALMRRSSVQARFEIPAFAAATEVSKFIEFLETKINSEEVDLNDPHLTGEVDSTKSQYPEDRNAAESPEKSSTPVLEPSVEANESGNEEEKS
jgi:von Willebrand factor type A domain